MILLQRCLGPLGPWVLVPAALFMIRRSVRSSTPQAGGAGKLADYLMITAHGAMP